MASIEVARPSQSSHPSVYPTQPAVPEDRSRRPRRAINVAVWVLQGVLALLFLSSGGMKLALPLDVLAAQTPLPGLEIRLIGVVEVLGAIGLILPQALRIRPGLTTLAAACLAVEMVVATAFTLAAGQGPVAVMPFAVGALAACVAYHRQSLLHPGS